LKRFVLPGYKLLVNKILRDFRDQFPILKQEVNGVPLIYLDNAATSQKPAAVILAESEYYQSDNANIHRAPHELGERATAAYEKVRESVREFINAESIDEIIFTKGTTDSVNLVANSLSQFFIKPDSEILLTELEHHSNIVPWQIVAKRVGASVLAAKVTSSGEIDLADFEQKLNAKTAVVSFAHVSNALGTVHPVEKLVSLVRKKVPGALIFIDGAQWISHAKTDVRALDADFYAFSAHKVYGPTGVGILYGKKELLLKMPPVNGGGDMIERVSFAGTTFAKPPYRFEAGTPNIAGVIGLGAALEFLKKTPWKELEDSESEISKTVVEELAKIKRVTIVGNPKRRMCAVSFTVDAMAPMDVAVKLNQYGVAVRAGHHCCMPLMEALGLPGTVRASWSGYTTREEILGFSAALKKIVMEEETRPQELGELTFGKSFASSAKQALAELREVFLSSAESRAELLLEFGAAHPRRLEILRKLAPEVQGCMSEVRMVTRSTADGKIQIASDSNTEIVRGLLTIVERVFSGQSKEEIKELGPESLFAALDLPGFVSMQRRTGLESVLREISKSINK